MNTTNIVLVSGWKGSGKDSFSDILVDHYKYKKYSFATALKDEVSIQYEIPREYFESRLLKEKALLNKPLYGGHEWSLDDLLPHFRTEEGLIPLLKENIETRENLLYYKNECLYWTPRALLIVEARTKLMIDPLYFCRKMLVSMKQTLKTQSVVVADWRYNHEYDYIVKNFSKHSTVTIRIDTDKNNECIDSSENSLDSFPFHRRIFNDHGGLSSFHERVQCVWTTTDRATRNVFQWYKNE